MCKAKTRGFGSINTFPFTTIGRILVACIPKMADCGGLMMGVPNSDPNTPPLEIVKVPEILDYYDVRVCMYVCIYTLIG